MHIKQDKDRLRKIYSGIRQKYVLEHKDANNFLISKLFLHITTNFKDKTLVIAAFSAIKEEPNLLPLLELLEAESYISALPVIEEKESALTFRRWHKGLKLVHSDNYRIEEPPKTEDIVIPDILLVPFLVADQEGNRIGYGKGYYDRTIRDLKRQNPKLHTIGVGFSCQIIDTTLPVGHFDEKLDEIVTA